MCMLILALMTIWKQLHLKMPDRGRQQTPSFPPIPTPRHATLLSKASSWNCQHNLILKH